MLKLTRIECTNTFSICRIQKDSPFIATGKMELNNLHTERSYNDIRSLKMHETVYKCPHPVPAQNFCTACGVQLIAQFSDLIHEITQEKYFHDGISSKATLEIFD